MGVAASLFEVLEDGRGGGLGVVGVGARSGSSGWLT